MRCQRASIQEHSGRKDFLGIKVEESEKLAQNRKPEESSASQVSEPLIKAKLADYDTQFPDASGGKSSDIVIGFDLGTSTTKVVLRDPWASRAYAIPFSNPLSPRSSNYFLPTRLAINSDDCFSVPKLTEPYHLRNLKLNLIDDHEKIVYSDTSKGTCLTAFAAISVYIACVLRYVRQWFFENCKDIYEHHTINWQLHVGIPSKNFDEAIIKELFEKCAAWGWWLSVQKGPINMRLAEAITEIIHKATFDAGLHSDYINVIPEVAAEVAGYARSPRRDNGLHLLVDIGASTLDVSTFVLHHEGEDQYALLSTDVKRLGAFELHLMRLNKIAVLLNGTPYLKAWERVLAN